MTPEEHFQKSYISLQLEANGANKIQHQQTTYIFSCANKMLTQRLNFGFFLDSYVPQNHFAKPY